MYEALGDWNSEQSYHKPKLVISMMEVNLLSSFTVFDKIECPDLDVDGCQCFHCFTEAEAKEAGTTSVPVCPACGAAADLRIIDLDELLNLLQREAFAPRWV